MSNRTSRTPTPSRSRALGWAAFAASAALLAPQAAHAETRHVYDARFEAKVYLRTSEATEGSKVTREQVTGFRLRGGFSGLRFVDGRLLTSKSTERVTTSDVSASEKFVNNWGSPPIVRSCGEGEFENNGDSMIYPVTAFDPSAGPLTVALVPFTSVRFSLLCNIETPQIIGYGGRAHGARTRTRPDDHFRVTFTIPRDQFGDHEIELPIDHHSETLATCPGASDKPDLRACVSDVRGTIRLTRTFFSAEDADDDDLIAPLVPVRPRIDRRARRARVGVRCPSGCGVRIRIFLPPRRGRGRLGRASAAGGAIADRRTNLRPGRAVRTVTVPIPPARRAALIAAGVARVEVTLDPPRGRTVRRTLGVVVGL